MKTKSPSSYKPKKSYSSPQLRYYGKLAEITFGNGQSGFDGFPSGGNNFPGG